RLLWSSRRGHPVVIPGHPDLPDHRLEESRSENGHGAQRGRGRSADRVSDRGSPGPDGRWTISLRSDVHGQCDSSRYTNFDRCKSSETGIHMASDV
ncbi:hypothetical protein KXX06_006417, partial [Aspergillus fumigatus]